MKRLLLIVLPLLLMVGCEDNKKSVDPLVGIYNMTSISMETITTPVETLTINHDGTNNYLVFILGDDGVTSFEGKIDGNYSSEGGTWSSTGNKLTLTSDGVTDIWDFTLTGNNLVMTITYPGDEDMYERFVTYNFTKE